MFLCVSMELACPGGRSLIRFFIAFCVCQNMLVSYLWLFLFLLSWLMRRHSKLIKWSPWTFQPLACS